MTPIDRLKALSPTAQLVAGLIAILVLATVLTAAYFSMRPKYEILFSDLRPADAATIVAKLDEDKIPYRLADKGATILVPAKEVDALRLGVMSADLPLKGTVGFELFNKSDMGLTEFAQRINYQRALQGELSRTIMTIDTVDAARVHLTLPEPSVFRADRRPAKASVTLTTRTGQGLDPQAVAGIQRLVAASVPDLGFSDVVVLDEHGRLVSEGATQQASDAVEATPRRQRARAIEDYYAAAVRQALESVQPDALVKVRIAVDQWAALDRDDALSLWTPSSRDFALQVDVTSPAGFTETERRAIDVMVSEAVGSGAQNRDLVTFPAWIDDPIATEPSYEATPHQDIVARPASPQPSLPWLATGGGLVLLIGVVALLARRSRPARRLTDVERQAFVGRLRRLLQDPAADGV